MMLGHVTGARECRTSLTTFCARFGRTAAIVTVVWCAASANAQGSPRHDAMIREGEIKRDLFILAGEGFRGREAGTLDELRASIWVADAARAAGLKPAGENGSYFQWWSLRRNRVASSSRVMLGDATVPLWTDAVPTNVTDALVTAPVAWLGEGGPVADAIDVNGKVAVAMIMPPANPPGPNVSLRAWRYARAAAVQTGNRLVARGAAAVILVADSTTESALDFLGVVQQRGSYGLDSANVNQRPRTVAPVLVVRRGWLDRAKSATAATVEFRSESFLYPSVNIVAVAPGTDSVLKNEYVLYSGHQDHDGVRFPVNGDSTWSGADDNASVSVAMLAIGRAFAKVPGKRSALFVWHGAEERGLLGSRYHAANPMVPRDQIVAVLNADMIGRNHPDSAALLGVQPPHLNSRSLVAMAFAANAQTAKFVIDTLWDRPTHPEGWYFRSDHLPYARLGIPAIEYSTLLHPDYHTPRDKPSAIDVAKLTRVARWMDRTGWLVANAKDRPALEPGFKLER